MEILKNILIRNWIGLFIAIVIFCFLVQTCNEKNRIANNLEASQTNVSTYKNHLGTITSSLRTATITNKELRKTINDTVAGLIKKFSTVKTITQFKTNTVFDTIKVEFKTKIPCEFSLNDSIKEQWYSFNYNLNAEGLKINKLLIPNEQIVVTGYKRKWFLGQQIATTEITNTNPNVIVNQIKATEVIVPKKWYENVFIWLGAGAITGALIVK